MGNYATSTSLQVIMIGTKFDTATSALADKMISQAEAEVNKYISNRYDVSKFVSPNVPEIVTTLSEQLATGYMYRAMSRGGKEAETRAKSYIVDAIANLKDIRDYKANVTDASGSAIPENSGSGYSIKSTTSEYANTFNEDDQLNWEVDQAKLDDIEIERETNG